VSYQLAVLPSAGGILTWIGMVAVYVVRWRVRTMEEGYNPHLQQKILKLKNP